ncbi:MAG: hypothetical protein ACP5OP_00175 [Leptospirillia bacterium]
MIHEETSMTQGGGDPLDSLEAILRSGTPDQILADEMKINELSDIVDFLAEEGELSSLADLAPMTPAWSLFIRNYLEMSHDRFDLEMEGEETESPSQEQAVFGLGIILDLDCPIPPRMTLEALAPLARLVETILSPEGSGAEVFLHPRMLSFADLYTFSYDSRRGFVDERMTFGFSMDSSGSLDRIPLMNGDAPLGDWDQPAEILLAPNDPIRRAFGKTLDNGRGAIVGLVRMTPPEEEWGDFLDRRFSSEIGETMGTLVAQIFDLTAPFGEGDDAPERGQVSLVPWSLMLPMGVTIEMGAFISEALEDQKGSGKRGKDDRKSLEITPVWRDGTLTAEMDGLSASGKGPAKFPVVDDYVAGFMENYVPEIVQSMMGLTVRWNKKKGGGRFLSLGVL